MNILVTGGSGYIGSHTVLELIEIGCKVTVLDNLYNSSPESVRRVEQITGKPVDFHVIDLKNEIKLKQLFKNKNFDAVIHFAGLKAVGESVDEPLKYYDNNLISTITLLKVMAEFKVKKLIFSSSATVYKQDEPIPWTEKTPVGTDIASPYGRTKYMIEQILTDYHHANSPIEVCILRYFNPVGAHPSGKIGEDPNGVPNNLMPFISQVAIGKRKLLSVYGNDYDTHDGTCVRDYIHVQDLAKGHVAALEYLSKPTSTFSIFNLGSGKGSSVLEVIKAFEKASGIKINYRVAGRRSGDSPCYYADPTLANEQLDWKTEKTLKDICEDAWRWQSGNPDGYPN